MDPQLQDLFGKLGVDVTKVAIPKLPHTGNGNSRRDRINRKIISAWRGSPRGSRAYPELNNEAQAVVNKTAHYIGINPPRVVVKDITSNAGWAYVDRGYTVLARWMFNTDSEYIRARATLDGFHYWRLVAVHETAHFEARARGAKTAHDSVFQEVETRAFERWGYRPVYTRTPGYRTWLETDDGVLVHAGNKAPSYIKRALSEGETVHNIDGGIDDLLEEYG